METNHLLRCRNIILEVQKKNKDEQIGAALDTGRGTADA